MSTAKELNLKIGDQVKLAEPHTEIQFLHFEYFRINGFKSLPHTMGKGPLVEVVKSDERGTLVRFIEDSIEKVHDKILAYTRIINHKQ